VNLNHDDHPMVSDRWGTRTRRRSASAFAAPVAELAMCLNLPSQSSAPDRDHQIVPPDDGRGRESRPGNGAHHRSFGAGAPPPPPPPGGGGPRTDDSAGSKPRKPLVPQRWLRRQRAIASVGVGRPPASATDPDCAMNAGYFAVLSEKCHGWPNAAAGHARSCESERTFD